MICMIRRIYKTDCPKDGYYIFNLNIFKINILSATSSEIICAFLIWLKLCLFLSENSISSYYLWICKVLEQVYLSNQDIKLSE